jgi:dienelactone hydrolase
MTAPQRQVAIRRSTLRVRTWAANATLLMALAGCSTSHLESKPGAYDVAHQPVPTSDRYIHATYVHPVTDRHPGTLIVFSTGDDGWSATSAALFRHLAEESYTIAGFSAPEVIEPFVRSGERISTARAAQALNESFARAKRYLGLPDSAPVLIVGFSRGASVVAFTAAHPQLQGGIAGGVAIALTREADYLHVPAGDHGSAIQVDDQGRLQLYPALKLLGTSRVAVIQSTHDDYVPSAESRTLLGPDTPRLRLYEIEASDHGFSNARDELLADLDEALRWIQEAAPAR